MSFSGKKVVVTGANRSIGQAIAIQLAKMGADVVISYRSDQVGAEKTLNELKNAGSRAEMIYADFSRNDACSAFSEKALAFLGGIDFLVNNAGMLARETFFDMTPEKMALVFQVNTVAPFYLTQLFAKNMVENNVKGSIVNISSIAGTCTMPRGVAYAASKAALNKWTQNSALNLAPHGIRVNAVAPGVVEAGMNQDTAKNNPHMWQENLKQIPLQRPGQPDDIANMVLYLLSEKSAWITGKIYEVDGGHVL